MMSQQVRGVDAAGRFFGTWRRFVVLFLSTFIGGLVATALFILLVDPYDVIPFSLPIKRPIVSIAQRYVYPQLIRSRRFESLIMGSSTARPLDPAKLGELLGLRFANLSMNAASAEEQ